MTASADFVDIVRHASANHTPLSICGGGTKKWYGQQLTGTELDTTGYAGIIDYDPSELVITARCGTRLSEIERALLEHRQMLAFEPPGFGPAATIGGVIAAGLSGPRRPYAGAVRDFVLGVVLLNGHGEQLRFGGRVMKNVAGYDVSRLLSGSLGSLGLMLDLSIKVLPMPHNEVTLQFAMTQEQALQAMNGWNSKPIPISATSWEAQAGSGRLMVRLSCSEASTSAAVRQLGGEQVDDQSAQQHWAALREQHHPFFTDHAVIWRVALPNTTAAIDLGGAQLIEWGGAQRWVGGSSLSANQLREQVLAAGGHATLFRGGDKSAGVFQPLAPSLLRIQRRLKSAFDPAGIFNPGRLYPEL